MSPIEKLKAEFSKEYMSKTKMRMMATFILDKIPYFGGLRRQLNEQGAFPLGHYYSPIPKRSDVLDNLNSEKSKSSTLEEIDLRKDSQFELLSKYQLFYEELPFSVTQQSDCRYYYENGWFPYADAIFLYSFLRDTQPKKIIEVGSGFSSAVILDTVERFYKFEPELTFIEPFPERLNSILTENDKKKVKIIENRVQDLELETLTSLSAGDLLFIDSSHVLKYGSDVQFLMFEVIPKLPAGVFVHFHDIFYPFEYSAEWLAEGRYWNENYFLRAFLAYNQQWEIYFFNSYIAICFEDFLANKLPLCLKNTGGSIYLRKTGKG